MSFDLTVNTNGLTLHDLADELTNIAEALRSGYRCGSGWNTEEVEE